ncbi:unnamed protein product [Brachionus calyciflorus]|uniref:BEN domain-containing protein n=1 Tax=Brachionus calyciflorus TaxID=104777 RepID=A0A814HEB7_9BILA|nr:unnamed protein product [Brachionus calyciflorus]
MSVSQNKTRPNRTFTTKEDIWFLVDFLDGSYASVLKKLCKIQPDNKHIKVKIKNKYYEGVIVKEGNKKMIEKIVNTLEVNIVHTSDENERNSSSSENDDEYDDDDDDDVELSQSQAKSMKRHSRHFSPNREKNTDDSILNDLIQSCQNHSSNSANDGISIRTQQNSDEVTRLTIDPNPILIEERHELGDREISPNLNDIPQTSREILNNDLSSSNSQNQESNMSTNLIQKIAVPRLILEMDDNAMINGRDMKIITNSLVESINNLIEQLNQVSFRNCIQENETRRWIFNGVDLLKDIRSKDPYEFAKDIIPYFFSEQEIQDHILCYENEKSSKQSSRSPVPKEKLDEFISCIKTKWDLTDEKFNRKYYKDIKKAFDAKGRNLIHKKKKAENNSNTSQ